MRTPLALFGLDVGSLVEKVVTKLVDLLVPDVGAHWASGLVRWLVALPPISGPAFPSINQFAHDLTAVGFGLLGATAAAASLQHWTTGLTGGTGSSAEALRRCAIAAIALTAYPTLIRSTLTATNLLTAAITTDPLVIDGLDSAFGTALAVAAVTHGLSLGLAVGAALAVLYFVAALLVFKIALTAILAVVVVSGALVWGLYPLQQTAWLTRAWTAGVITALVVPIAWACVFATGALLAHDTLVFDGGSSFNGPLDQTLSDLVKPFSAVACFWLAYKTPSFLLATARAAGAGPATVLRPGPITPTGGRSAAAGNAISRGVQTNTDRFRALAARATNPTTPKAPRTPAARATTPVTPTPTSGAGTPAGSSAVSSPGRLTRILHAPARVNRWWQALPGEGAAAHTRAATPTLRPTTSTPTAAGTRAPVAGGQPARRSQPSAAPVTPQPPARRRQSSPAAAPVVAPPASAPMSPGQRPTTLWADAAPTSTARPRTAARTPSASPGPSAGAAPITPRPAPVLPRASGRPPDPIHTVPPA